MKPHHAPPHSSRFARQHRQKAMYGFTLIEILLVVTLSVILTIGAAGLFFTTIIGNTKKNVISSVKDEGDYALSQIEFLLRNAIQIVPDPTDPTGSACQAGMTTMSFKSADEQITTISEDAGKIASKSAVLVTPAYLTSADVTLSGLTFDCQQAGANYGRYVTVSFTLQKNSPDANRPQPVVETFTTGVSVRNN